MKYQEILEKGTQALIDEQIAQGKTYSEATVAVKKQLIAAREEAFNDKEYHNVNVQAWGDGDGDEGLRAQYGTYDNVVKAIKAAENAASSLSALKVGVQHSYKLQCLKTIHEFPKKGYREEDADYAKKLDVYAQNVQDIQEEAKKVVSWSGRMKTLQAEGYDADDKSDYREYLKNLGECLEQLDNLPYSDLAAAQEVLQECASGLKKAEEKKADLQGTFGN